jgi:xylulokinase
VLQKITSGMVDPAEIAAIGVDGQSWSAVAVDKTGEVLCPTPIWMDTRAAEICERLEKNFGAERIFEICGNPIKPSYTLPKVLWYKENYPQIFRKTDKILQSNGYVVYRLTGEITQDVSQGYGWQAFDLRRGQFDTALCREMGIDPSLLPEVFPCHAIVGKVTKQASAETGLRDGIPVVAGGLDAACGTLGAGVLHDRETQEQGGQAGGMSICLTEYKADPRLILSYHVAPGRWLLQGGTVGGGGALRWLREILGDKVSFEDLSAEAAKIPPGSDGLVFLPYLAGERPPIWNEHANGVFFGLDYGKTQAHVARAVMEGVAFSLRHNLETAEQAGAAAHTLKAMGGAANSHVWTQIKADVTGKPIQVPAADTATTLGAAMLAGVAAGVYASFDDAVRQTVSIKRTHEPNPENSRVYDKGYKFYRELYEKLKDMMNREAGSQGEI